MRFWRDIRCLGCGYTITLPFPIRQQADPTREPLPKDAEHLAVLCPRCDEGYNYRLSDFRPYPRESPSPYRDGGELKMFDVLVECAGSKCKVPVALLAIRDASATLDSAKTSTANWKLRGIRCHAGYAPRAPLKLKEVRIVTVAGMSRKIALSLTTPCPGCGANSQLVQKPVFNNNVWGGRRRAVQGVRPILSGNILRHHFNALLL